MKDLNHRVRIYDMVISRLPASVHTVLCFFIEVSWRSSTMTDFLNISRVQHGWNAAYTQNHKGLRLGMQGGVFVRYLPVTCLLSVLHSVESGRVLILHPPG